MKVGKLKNEAGEKFLTEVASVPSPVDFDQMTETGFFFIEKGSELTNYPGNNPQTYGTLQVLSAGDNLTQMFLACGSAGTSVWERNRYRLDNGSLLFTGWRKLMLATAITESKASPGYFKLPGGMIVQWGAVLNITADGTTSATLPIAFPNSAFVATATSTGSGLIASAAFDGNSKLNVIVKGYPGSGSFTVYWIAIGY